MHILSLHILIVKDGRNSTRDIVLICVFWAQTRFLRIYQNDPSCIVSSVFDSWGCGRKRCYTIYYVPCMHVEVTHEHTTFDERTMIWECIYVYVHIRIKSVTSADCTHRIDSDAYSCCTFDCQRHLFFFKRNCFDMYTSPSIILVGKISKQSVSLVKKPTYSLI